MEVLALEVLGDLVEVALEALEGLVALVVDMEALEGLVALVVDMEDPVEAEEAAMGAVRRGGGEVQDRGTGGAMEGWEEGGGGWRTVRVEATGCQVEALVEGEASEEAVEVDLMEEDQVEALAEDLEALEEEMETLEGEMEVLEEAMEALEDLEVAVGAPRFPGSSVRRCRSRNAEMFLASSAGVCPGSSVGMCQSRSAAQCPSRSAGVCLASSAGVCLGSSAGVCQSRSAANSVNPSDGARSATELLLTIQPS